MTDKRHELIRERVHCAMRMAQIDIELGKLPVEDAGEVNASHGVKTADDGTRYVDIDDVIRSEVQRVNEATETARELSDE